MHLTGDYVKVTQSFNAKFWGEHTALIMEYIARTLLRGIRTESSGGSLQYQCRLPWKL